VNEHGNVFFYIMPSNGGPQRAASNRVHEQLVIVFEELCSCALVWSGLPTRLCEGMIKKDIPMLMRLTKDNSVALWKGQEEFSKS